MKKIPLTRGFYANVDDADYNWLRQWKWFAITPCPHLVYAAHAHVSKYKQTTIYMHRVILGLQPGNKLQTDHIDCNGLNNVRSNLRACTKTQNGRYARKWKSGTSKYKGACWDSDHEKWRSQIWVNRKQIYLGLFYSEKDAATAYNQAALEHFGKFALLNTF